MCVLLLYSKKDQFRKFENELSCYVYDLQKLGEKKQKRIEQEKKRNLKYLQGQNKISN
jgi:hypothetical protein